MAAPRGQSDNLPIPSKSAAIPRKRSFGHLVQKYTEFRMKNSGHNKVAMDMLLKELGSVGQAETFFRWAAHHFKDTTHFDYDRFTRMSNIEFRTQLANADWRRVNSALSLVNSRLCSSNLDHSMDYIPLGSFRKSWLALRADSKVMIPKEADSALLDSHKVAVVNSNNILGARYDCVAHGKEKQTLLFAQLGNILSTRIEDKHSGTSLTERHWDDTGFVLALEILESGSAGKFYMICNLTWQNEWEELSKEIYDDPWLLRLCGEEPPFTVAQVDGQDLGLLKDTWEKACEEKEEIRLVVLSTLRPEIVETGLVEDGNDCRLVALYPISDSGGT